MKLSKRITKFEKHHAALLIFLLVAGVFIINVFAFSAAYERVSETPASVVVVDSGPADEAVDESNSLSGLQESLTTLVGSQEVPTAVYVQDLQTGDVLGIDERTTFVSASFYKLFVGYEVARQIDLGLLAQTANSGFDAEGTSVAECLDRSLSYSDNDCGRALRKLIEADDAPTQSIAEAGFVGTTLFNEYPTTSAADVGLLFKRLYDGISFSSDTNDLLLNPLLDQEIDNRIPKGLPDDTKIAHKTADLDGYSHDGGIVYTDVGDYILVIMTGPWDNGYEDSPSTHIAISSLVYDWFTAQAPLEF